VETNLSNVDNHDLIAPFVLGCRNLPSRSTEDVGDDYVRVCFTLQSLLLFGPVDYITGCIDVGMREKLQSGLDLDASTVGESV
jgi:hypothetical protein